VLGVFSLYKAHPIIPPKTNETKKLVKLGVGCPLSAGPAL
jgi:hypothetical protein